MASDASTFKGALGWDDWIWYSAFGGVALLIFLLLLGCCVCVQRAKRKGRQEALATLQTNASRPNPARGPSRPQRVHSTVQRYQPPVYDNAAPSPSRGTRGPSGVSETTRALFSRQNSESKPYPSDKLQHTNQMRDHRRQQASPNAYMARYGYEAAESLDPLSHTDSLRDMDPYPSRVIGPDNLPYPVVTSPTQYKDYRYSDQNVATSVIKRPAVVPSKALSSLDPRTSTSSKASSGTLQARIDALRAAEPRSSGPNDLNRPSPGYSRAMSTQDSYASTLARRSGLQMGSVLSPHAYVATRSLQSGQSDDSYGSDRSMPNELVHSMNSDISERENRRPTTPKRATHGRGSIEF